MSESRVENFFGSVGGGGKNLLGYVGGMGYLFVESLYHYARLTLRMAVTRRSGHEAVWAQRVRVGVRSLPIVSLVLYFVGMILAFQMAYVLRDFGAEQLVAATVAVAMMRELGPLLTAIVMTGFAGASIAAEIGTMVVEEEILALETSAMNPTRVLVMPRVMACILMLLFLTVIANVVGILGGFSIATTLLRMSPENYYSSTKEYLKMQDLITGLIKSMAFGGLIALIGCREGLRVEGGAEGVGRATTRAVVYGIVAIIGTDLFFSWFFYMVL
jgi:phospholipid/cholesterol/gamma-HCH transport system permease protein